MSEDEVLRALKALRDSDAAREAGPEMEARLMGAYRRGAQRPRVRPAAGIAAVLVGLGVGLAALLNQIERPAEKLPIAAPPAPKPPTIVLAPVGPKPQAVQRKPRPRLREIVTQFYPLMDVPPPFERGEILRVSLPASALERAGFEVLSSDPDAPVEADVLIGEEGLARAIRFVSYQQ